MLIGHCPKCLRGTITYLSTQIADYIRAHQARYLNISVTDGLVSTANTNTQLFVCSFGYFENQRSQSPAGDRERLGKVGSFGLRFWSWRWKRFGSKMVPQQQTPVHLPVVTPDQSSSASHWRVPKQAGCQIQSFQRQQHHVPCAVHKRSYSWDIWVLHLQD